MIYVESVFGETNLLLISSQDKNAIPGHQLRWPGAIVPYEIDASLEKHEAKILEAIQHYAEKTCVTFKKRTYERDYIRLFSGQG
ncbi:hypothetical protein AVEN_32422-1, partial [Araneus ventricosus]|uniref:Peptidase M12A domain-containing protein n=1 Tax=Araneus ventricosus TaxID=182803 RepID=A0A4Y2J9W0_ARAVE